MKRNTFSYKAKILEKDRNKQKKTITLKVLFSPKNNRVAAVFLE